MSKLNPIATTCNFSSSSFYPTIVGSFYNLSCESFTSSFYTTRDRHAQRRDRYRSARSATRATPQNENVTIGRTKAQNPRFSAQKKGNIQRHETLTDRSLQAFLPAIAARTWDDIAHRYNLEKAAQVGTRSLQLTRKPLQKAARSTQLTGYQARSFWQWIEPPPDIPIRIPQGAASGVCARLQVLNIVERVLPPTMESAS